MPSLVLSRLTVVGFLLLLPGLYFTIRFSSGCLRMLVRKFWPGRPYLKGSASDYFWFAAGSAAVTLGGVLLLGASILQSGMQPYEATREIGTVRAEAPSMGRIRLTLQLGGTHPGQRILQADLPGSRWALEGEYLQWRGVPRWLGFSDGHRVAAALGTAQPAGAPDRLEDSRSLVAGVYSPWLLAHHHPAWIPLVRTSLRRSPWLVADGSTYKVLVTDAGYVLVAGEGKPLQSARSSLN